MHSFDADKHPCSIFTFRGEYCCGTRSFFTWQTQKWRFQTGLTYRWQDFNWLLFTWSSCVSSSLGRSCTGISQRSKKLQRDRCWQGLRGVKIARRCRGMPRDVKVIANSAIIKGGKLIAISQERPLSSFGCPHFFLWCDSRVEMHLSFLSIHRRNSSLLWTKNAESFFALQF